MLRFLELAKSYGTRTLFDGVTFAMTPGERLGFVGRNGSGKTTLLRLILGQETPDHGRIERPRDYKVGHLSQLLEFRAPTILEEACLDLPVQEGGYVEQHRAEEALMGLGFEVADFTRSPHEFSGGYQVRLQLAKVLVSAPNLLLLDEPTNYLDIISMRWLERYLRAWPGELIVITHDREFLDRVVTHSMIIHRGKVRRVQGRTEKLYEMLAKEEEMYEKARLGEERSRRETERFIERFRYKASKARQVQSRVKRLEKLGQRDRLEDIASLSFQFNSAPFQAHTLLEVQELAFGYEGGAELFADLTVGVEKGDRIAVIGKNGKGKSTLLNLIAGELMPVRGRIKRHPSLRLAHFGQTNIDRLHRGSTVEEEILASTPAADRGIVRGICGLMMFSGDDALKKVEVLSGGERARVLLGKLLVSPANLVLLDEPTNHLDMESIDSLIEALDDFEGGVVIVTHNERVLEALATRLVIFDRGRASVFEGTYEEFLERVGWSDEDEPGKEPAAAAGASRSERRRQRAELVAARAKALGSLKKRMQALEDAIVRDEEELAAQHKSLEEAAVAGDGARIKALGKRAAELQRQIDAQFGELEQVTTEHDKIARTYDEQLEDP
jgi:ATP-binding cassette subfamily F protein 3